MKQKYYKFLTNRMTSFWDRYFYYPVPTKDENGDWVPTKWIEEKNYSTSSEICNAGLHLMKIPNPKYGFNGNCFEAEGEGLLAEDDHKIRFKKIRLLRQLDLKKIFKPNVDLRNANLRNANLTDANLTYVDLRNANLRNANLTDANLTCANLRNANLRNADLTCANLRNADLRNADLRNANLTDANLTDANLTDANLTYADLTYADLTDIRGYENERL